MRKNGLVTILTMALALGMSPATVVHAQASVETALEERVVAALQAQGYQILEIGYTWFGRLRVVSENGEYRREMVFNPGTGEVMRDYSVLLATLEEPETNSGSRNASVKVTGTAATSGGSGGQQAASIPKAVPDPVNP